MPSPPLISALFPYTTLFRSGVVPGRTLQDVVRALHCLRICRRWRWVGDGARAGQQRERERACQRAKPADEQRPVQEVAAGAAIRSEEHTSELQSRVELVCRL